VITYWFELMVGPVPDLDVAAERLYEAFGDKGADGMLAGDERGGSITFSREAPSAMDAILSALDDAETAGLTVTGVVEDLVTVADIAEKTGKTAQAVGHWTTGARGEGFPEPVIHRGERIRLYSWAAVSAWLAATGRGEAEPGVAETAVAAAEVDAYLAVRRALQNAPSAYRDRVARLSAS
jgi:hypothetical protein